MFFKNNLIRNVNAGDLLEIFLISAVVSVFAIRFYLHIAGYPQIARGQFHIAHLLFGGFFMLGSIILLMVFLNKSSMRLAAVLGGIGFGTFIDELGKFITRDNNYFYQPTAALIYVIFALLYLIFRAIESDERYTKREYLMNALESMEDVVLQDLDKEEKKRVMGLLRKCDQKDPIVIALKEALEKIESVPPPAPGIFGKIKQVFHNFYVTLIDNKWFARILTLFFVVKSIITISDIVLFLFFLHQGTLFLNSLSFKEVGELLFSTLSGIFVVIGVTFIYKSRLFAYQMFYRSILVSIFLTEVFTFYREQFSAVTGLLFNILILIILQYMINEEKLAEKQE